jgi:hypothetical protein
VQLSPLYRPKVRFLQSSVMQCKAHQCCISTANPYTVCPCTHARRLPMPFVVSFEDHSSSLESRWEPQFLKSSWPTDTKDIIYCRQTLDDVGSADHGGIPEKRSVFVPVGVFWPFMCDLRSPLPSHHRPDESPPAMRVRGDAM